MYPDLALYCVAEMALNFWFSASQELRLQVCITTQGFAVCIKGPDQLLVLEYRGIYYKKYYLLV